MQSPKTTELLLKLRLFM